MTISRGFAALLLALTFFGMPGTSPAAAQELWSLSCGDLWYQRNAIYARNGYCFKTARALRVFGNANCTFYTETDVPMSYGERQLAAAIRAVERGKGCQF